MEEVDDTAAIAIENGLWMIASRRRNLSAILGLVYSSPWACLFVGSKDKKHHSADKLRRQQ
jgi:hypothetical protein